MSADKLKIAIYSGDIPSTTFIENLIEALSEQEFEVYLFGKLRRKVNYKENIKLFPTPQSSLRLIIFVILEGAKLFIKNKSKFNKTIKQLKNKNKNKKSFVRNLGFILPVLNNQPDIFHIQWAKTVNLNYELYNLLDCKIAVSLRGAHINYSPLNDPELKKAYEIYFPKTDGFHAVSKAIAGEAVKYGADKNKIRVIHSSVKDEFLLSYAIRKNRNDIFEIISIGRHHWKKGYHYALDAMNYLKEEGFKFNYTIIAQGDIPEEILFLLNEYRLNDHVKIIKGMEHVKLMEKLKSSDLLLLPSVEEGIANVALEAMSSGVTTLSTDCGGMNEVIHNGENGFIIPVRDPKSISGKIMEISRSDPETLLNISLNALDTIKAEFSREKQKREFSEFYNSLVDG